MNSATQAITVAGPAGALECALDVPPPGVASTGLALLCHPHPLHGGTMDNKVVQTMARAAVASGWRAARFNFRGVGGSAGQWDAGVGEVDDALAVLQALRQADEAVLLGGFSFGGYVAAAAARRLAEASPAAAARRLLLVAPAVQNFEVGTVPAGSFVVHGEQDDVVPLAAALAWARPQAHPITVIPGAGHFFHGQLPLLKSLLLGALR